LNSFPHKAVVLCYLTMRANISRAQRRYVDLALIFDVFICMQSERKLAGIGFCSDACLQVGIILYCLSSDFLDSPAAFSRKRNVTIWRSSVCLSVPSAYSPWLIRDRMWRGLSNYVDGRNCRVSILVWPTGNAWRCWLPSESRDLWPNMFSLTTYYVNCSLMLIVFKMWQFRHYLFVFSFLFRLLSFLFLFAAN